jgi:phage terminase large subunit
MADELPPPHPLVTLPASPAEFVERYSANPEAFVAEVLGVEADPWQRQVLRWVFVDRERRVSIRACHGPGKTACVAWITILWMLTRFPQKAVLTAPTSAQLFDALYAEIRRWVNVLPPALKALLDVKGDRIELATDPAESFVSARTSRAESPEALQGVHSDHVLLVVDEASGVPEQVFEAAQGSMSGDSACTILLSNPTRTSGYFFESQTRMSSQWKTMRVSHEDSPRVSPKFVEEIAKKYGRDSNVFRVRCLGEFPVVDDSTVIPYHLVDSAVRRQVIGSPSATVVWGLDVARMGSDSTVLCVRKGREEPIFEAWNSLDLMQTTGRVKAKWDTTPVDERPFEIFVDSIGLGSGVLDRLRELGLPAQGINVAETPALAETYANVRAELWYKGKAWLEKRDCALPDDLELIQELTSVRYSFTSSGKLKIESKDEIRKRIGRSCDKADAWLLTLAGDAVGAMYGSASGAKWGQPIRRNLAGVV